MTMGSSKSTSAMMSNKTPMASPRHWAPTSAAQTSAVNKSRDTVSKATDNGTDNDKFVLAKATRYPADTRRP